VQPSAAIDAWRGFFGCSIVDRDRVAGAVIDEVGYVPLARSAKGSAADASGR
jgi:hypothetical protein